jgi:hypothetical protein
MGHAQRIDRSIFQQHEDEVQRDREELMLAELPPRRHPRWRPRQKKMVVLAVQSGLLPLHEAMANYELSIEEFQSWVRDFGPRPSFNGGRIYPAVDYPMGQILRFASR